MTLCCTAYVSAMYTRICMYAMCALNLDVASSCVGSSVIPMIVYLASNIFFTYLDLTGRPAALLKYKIQEEKAVPVSWDS